MLIQNSFSNFQKNTAARKISMKASGSDSDGSGGTSNSEGFTAKDAAVYGSLGLSAVCAVLLVKNRGTIQHLEDKIKSFNDVPAHAARKFEEAASKATARMTDILNKNHETTTILSNVLEATTENIKATRTIPEAVTTALSRHDQEIQRLGEQTLKARFAGNPFLNLNEADSIIAGHVADRQEHATIRARGRLNDHTIEWNDEKKGFVGKDGIVHNLEMPDWSETPHAIPHDLDSPTMFLESYSNIPHAESVVAQPAANSAPAAPTRPVVRYRPSAQNAPKKLDGINGVSSGGS